MITPMAQTSLGGKGGEGISGQGWMGNAVRGASHWFAVAGFLKYLGGHVAWRATGGG